ncbi:MAG: TRAP transporter large permease [Desulfitobacteriaceae bacterium]
MLEVEESLAPAGESILINRIKSGVDKFFNVIVALAVMGELIVMFTNIVSRVVFNTPILWSQEVGQLALVVITFIGGALALPRGEHISVEIVVKYLPPRWRDALGAVANWFIFGISFACAILGIETAFEKLNSVSVILRISLAWYTLPMIIGMLLLAYYGLERLWKYPRRIVLSTGAVLGVLIFLIWVTQPVWMDLMNDNIVLSLTLVTFVLLLMIGIPIGFVLAAGSFFYLYVSHGVPLTALPLAMQMAVSNFILLAIPFFILTGLLMTEGGLSRRLIEFVMSLVGRVRGGLLHVIIIVMYIVSGLSGSKVADVAAVGSTTNESLRKEGYHPGEGAAVLAAAAVMGETIPPSMAMLILGSITTLSMGALFVAGLLPAVVIAVCIMILISIRARMSRMPISPRVPLKETKRRALVAIPALLAPVMLIGGIVGGIGTPTEVSSSAVVYSMLLGVVIYREINLKAFWHILLESAAKTGMVLFIISTASAFSWTLTIARVPHELARLLTSLGGSAWAFMLATIIILIVMGAVLEGLPAILIFGPLLLPIAPQFGINPLQLGIVLIIAMGIGAFLPPIGVGAYVCVSVSKTTLEDMMHHMLPYLLVLIIGLLLVAFVPWFSLVLPRVFNLIK